MIQHPVIVIATVVLATALLRHFAARPAERAAGLALARRIENEVKPITRHPLIDPMKCLLCRACVEACPEADTTGGPLAVVDGRLALVDPLRCIGHGECQTACPTGAITVGLGELANDPTFPQLTHENESVVPGIFVAGEVSGLPLIRNAVAQGKSVVRTIAARLQDAGPREKGVHDVIIVGLGPAGFAAALAAHEAGLRYLAIEQGDFGGAVANYPRQKIVLTGSLELPVHGEVARGELGKEELLAIWRSAAERAKLRCRLRERVESIQQQADGLFEVRTSGGRFRAQAVVLAVGRRGTPRRLGIPGEKRTKVAYGLVDPGLYVGRKILIVGGGDSAVEAALVLARANEVSMSYRRAEFFRLQPQNLARIEAAIERGEVAVFFESEVAEISDRSVSLRCKGEDFTVDNDQVFVMIGGEPPFAFLRSAGVIAGEPQGT